MSNAKCGDGVAHLIALLNEAGVTKSSVIRVVGPGSLPAVLWFCRHGFDQAGCVRAGEGAPHEGPDAVLAAAPCCELELKRLLSAARDLHPGGVFIFQLRNDPGCSPGAIEWLLQHGGFELERRIDKGRRALVMARRCGLTLRPAA